MAELEKAGVPTVAYVDQSFARDWQGSAKVFGVKQLARAVVPRPFVGLEAEDVYPYVDGAFDDLVKGLTTAQEFAEEEGTLAAEVIAIEGEDRYDALERMNRVCLHFAFSHGLGRNRPVSRPPKPQASAH